MNNALFNYTLRLADSSLILGHRLSELCGHGPILEEDIACTNMALDLIGSATSFYEYAASIDTQGRSADDLAYLRDAQHFYNNLLVEQPNGDFAQLMLRQFLFSAFTYHLYSQLQNSNDQTIAGIAAKALKETTYHLRHSRQWVIRLGDGTNESMERLHDAFAAVWKYAYDMFELSTETAALVQQGTAVDPKTFLPAWEAMVHETLALANTPVKEKGWQMLGSINGKHTEHLGFLLAEMQFLPRTYPNSQW